MPRLVKGGCSARAQTEGRAWLIGCVKGSSGSRGRGGHRGGAAKNGEGSKGASEERERGAIGEAGCAAPR